MVSSLDPPRSYHELELVVSQTEGEDLNRLYEAIGLMFERRRLPNYSPKHERLIWAIKSGGPSAMATARHAKLLAKNSQGELSTVEELELRRRTEDLNRWSVQRLELVNQLVEAWKISPREIFRLLQLK